ncbi:MAG: TlpA disulfide reductase family protein [Candidatus Omnitrophota bacterium]
MKNILNRKVLLCLCLCFFMSGNLLASAYLEKSLLGEKAADFSLASLDQDRNFTLKDYKGKPMIMFFFTTWCPYCVKKLPELAKNKNTYKKQQIQMVVVNVGESRRKVQSFVDSKNLSLDILLDENSKTATRYGVVGVPTYVLVDSNGIVRYKGNDLPRNYLKLLQP